MKNKHAKAMIENLTTTDKDDVFQHLNLPWITHPLSYIRSDDYWCKDKRVLHKLKRTVSDTLYRSVIDYMNDLEGGFNFSIVFLHSGDEHNQINGFPEIEVTFANQYENGGISGDSYAGQVWIPITPKRYFSFHYAM